jgi:hypothetical protein
MLIEWLLTALEMGVELLVKIIKRRRHWNPVPSFFLFLFDFTPLIYIV